MRGVSGPWGGASMTEAEWLACDDPGALLGVIQQRLTERKARLIVGGAVVLRSIGVDAARA